MKVVLKWKFNGKILGQPKQRWMDKVDNNIEQIGVRDEETVVQDRNKLKQVCET